jgi:virginiamycin A acetyltransferase
MARVVKEVVGFLIFLLFSLPLDVIYSFIFRSNRKAFTTISELICLLPGYFGYFVRQGFYRFAIGAGNNLDVGFGTILEHPTIIIDDDVYIGQNSTIGNCYIAPGVKIGSNVDIISGGKTHKISADGKILPTDYNDLKQIKIGKDTWIGNSAVVLADIGANCIIGAGSVVVKPIPGNSVAVGNPARVIKRNIKTPKHG